MKGTIKKLRIYRKEANPKYEVFAPIGMTFDGSVHSRIAWDDSEAKELASVEFIRCQISDCDVCEENGALYRCGECGCNVPLIVRAEHSKYHADEQLAALVDSRFAKAQQVKENKENV